MPLAKLHFREDRWEGNQWASIAIAPHDAAYFLPLLGYFCLRYGVAVPLIVDLLDGYAADFAVLGTHATIHIDTWSFSVAFADQAVRDRVLMDLQTLPVDYFEVAEGDGHG